MALAETFLRKIHKLGIVPQLIQLLPRISFFLALSSILWLLVLPMDGNYRDTYISENALMPSQVMSYFRESEWNIVRGYREEVTKMEYRTIDAKNAQIEEWLNKFGFVTSYHKNGVVSDTLYGIMHAPRGDDTEAMVLTVPWWTSDNEYNEGGIAISAALARYFSKASIWSKNIIFVFPENGHYPLRSWVEAYHTSLENTAGSIEAAIVMEYGKNGDNFEYYEVAYEGLNGQLPNLDLLNTANLIAYHESIACSIQNTPANELSINTYFTRLRTLFRGILNLTLSGLKQNTPGCEAFSGWQIQAITIKAKGTQGRNDVTQFGRVVDSTFRSVNNLLEKFHQSFFFYLMLSPRNFVSIGTYLPSAILIGLSFILSSLSCLLNSKIAIGDVFSNINKILTVFTGVEVFCYGLAVILPFLTLNSPDRDLAAFQILNTFLLSNFVMAILPYFKFNFKFNRVVTFGLISFSLFFISMLITTLLIVHFSLALIIGLLSLPLTFVQPLMGLDYEEKLKRDLKESKKDKAELKRIAELANRRDLITKLIEFIQSHKTRIKVSLSLVVSNPFFIIFIVGTFMDLDLGATELTRGLLTSWDELQSWTWFIVLLGWFPAWLTISISHIFGDFEVDYSKVIEKLKVDKKSL